MPEVHKEAVELVKHDVLQEEVAIKAERSRAESNANFRRTGREYSRPA
jgi:hypothetical protein